MLVHHAPVVVADLHPVGLLVQTGIESLLVQLVVAQPSGIDAVARGRLMQAHERVGVVPVTTRGVAAIHHDDVTFSVRVDQRIGEGHARCPCADHQVVRLDRAHYQRWRAKKSRVRVHASPAAASSYMDGASQLLNAWPAA